MHSLQGKRKRGLTATDDQKSERDGLLVFGYSCRMYAPPTDAATAAAVFDPTISWNGDDSVKIDRYDCRLYLSSLAEFDRPQAAVIVGDPDQSMEERLEEEMCDEERYLDMYDAIRRAEEDERLKRGKGAEIAFSYCDDSSTNMNAADAGSSSSEEEVEEPYEVPPDLKLPVGIDLPETMKQSAIIERTASFVVSKGPQMEIVIKAKQRNDDSQFGFLEFDNRLNPFYKYICKLIREKKYTPTPRTPKTRPKSKKIRRLAEERERTLATTSHALKLIAMHHGSDDDSEAESDEDGYLHPLLRAKEAEPITASNAAVNSSAMGPQPRPASVEPPAPDFDEILSKLQHVNDTNNVYSSLYKNLNAIIPMNKQENEIPMEKPADFTPEVQYEMDEAKVQEYNDWHLTFYDRLSPFLPNGPPVALPPPPNLSSPLGIAARYVAMNGAAAEQRLIDHNGDNCSFLLPNSPYYTYYQARVRQTQWTLRQAYLSSIPSQGEASGMLSEPPKTSTTFSVGEHTGLVKVTAETALPETNECAENAKALSEGALKRERKERARLFMEKILNEKLAAKKRQQDGDRPSAPNAAAERKTSMSDVVNTPKISTDKLSELINAKIQHVFTSSPLLAPVVAAKSAAVDKPSSSPKRSHDDNRAHRHHRRSHSRERRHRKRSRSPEDDERRRHRRDKKHKSPRKSHSSRHRSRSPP